MKALILNSGVGSRMGNITENHPKCMTQISTTDTIISLQLRLLAELGIQDVVVTTGPFEENLISYCENLNLGLNIRYVNNTEYKNTNYIYSIYLAKEYLKDDILLLHGDLVVDRVILEKVLGCENSCVAIDSLVELPEKDFKATISKKEKDIFVEKIGIEFFENAVASQPLYKLLADDWGIWLEEICVFCTQNKVKFYAENALNNITNKIKLQGIEVENAICREIDNPEDLKIMKERLLNKMNKNGKSVYMCFSTDIIHGGHINIIKKASQLGKLTIGILSDEVVASYKRFPILTFEERAEILENIVGVDAIIEQKELGYTNVINELRPDYVVHGDDWKVGIQKQIREEVIELLQATGGTLIEYPFTEKESFERLENEARKQLSMPDMRRARLRKALDMKGLITVMEAHSGITGLIVEKSVVIEEGKTNQFDAMWVSSLCDSTAKGKPDIELVDMSSRFRTIDDIMEVTTKPIILDGDTGGLTEHFVYNVKTLERMGVSAVIIEDKTGLKKNSLFGTEVEQTQDTIPNFCEKISAGKRAQNTKEFMIIARIESLILEQGMEDAIERAFAYVEAGADGIMIHSRKKSPDEIFEFVRLFRDKDTTTPIVVVPTSFNTVEEKEFKEKGVNVVIYANQLTRSGFPAMKNVAELILKNHRAKEADDVCMSIQEILTLIPEEN